ncbi:MAG: peptidase S11 [Chromatiaceae bacterium]|nr:MAG: peptidase S11 [Chromatiaceae bacterium]
MARGLQMISNAWAGPRSGRIARAGILFGALLLPLVASAAPQIRSGAALVIDHHGHRLFERHADEPRPIASITKLMTAMVVLDAEVPLEDRVTITEQDRDRLRHSRSRLRIDQATLSRADLLRVSLLSSDNRAAAALGRTTFAGGTPAFVTAMNAKAQTLGMRSSVFADASGLDGGNRASPEDLVRLLHAAARYPFIREVTSTSEFIAQPYADGSTLEYRNTNPLVRDPRWVVEISKTGYLNEAGRCLVMQAQIAGRRLYIVLLDAAGQMTPMADANRLRDWLAAGGDQRAAAVAVRAR